MLLLDEPTSALDPVAEARVFADARRYATDRTVVLISHRLAGVREADLIVVLRHGSIVEQGTHAALMERHGDYSAMVALQSRS
jgi:ATP-binding cassette, subfamily B, bacterial